MAIMIFQHRGYAVWEKDNEKDGKSKRLLIVFNLGPLRFSIIVNVPSGERRSAPFYVQVMLEEKDDWKSGKE